MFNKKLPFVYGKATFSFHFASGIPWFLLCNPGKIHLGMTCELLPIISDYIGYKKCP